MKKSNKIKILLSWIGNNDLKSFGLYKNLFNNDSNNGCWNHEVEFDNLKSPFASIISLGFVKKFDEICILSDHPTKMLEAFKNKFKEYLKYSGCINYKFQYYDCSKIINSNGLHDPTIYNNIYIAVDNTIRKIQEKHKNDTIEWNFYISPGTAAMESIWILIGKSTYGAKLYKTWKKNDKEHIEEVEIPFNIIANFTNYVSNFLKEKNINKTYFNKMIYEDKKIRDLMKQALIYAQVNENVIIYGESGTGKELFAEAIHYESNRHSKNFIKVNCSGIAEGLFESDLFGAKRGAYTGSEVLKEDKKGYFQEADKGTIFLDEITEIPYSLQAKLLHAIQNGEIQIVGEPKQKKVDVRIITATNKNIEALIDEGKFREDLYYRLDVLKITLPPLRERKGCAIKIANKYLHKLNQKYTENKQIKQFKEKEFDNYAKEFIEEYSWPGNVRQLQHVLTKAVLDTNCIEKNQINRKDIEKYVKYEDVKQEKNISIINEINNKIDKGEKINLRESIKHIQDLFLIKAYLKYDSNKEKAAEFTGYGSGNTF